MGKIAKLNGLWLQVPAHFQHAITSVFDAPRNYVFAPDRLQKHEGIDFAPVPRPVKDSDYPVGVAYLGVVQRTGELTASAGKYVVVNHVYQGIPFFTWYCHLKRIDVKNGQHLLTGDLIGLAGYTGNVYPKGVKGTHLHFNLCIPQYGRKNYVVADVVDPLPYLVAG